MVRTTILTLAAVVACSAWSLVGAQPAPGGSAPAARHACALLSIAEIRTITGRQDMPADSYGDEW